jgi:hypothetical protein
LHRAFAGSKVVVKETLALSLQTVLEAVKQSLKNLLRNREQPADPDAPFAMVGAKLNPRGPLGRSSVSVQPEP